ncbi:conserved hypothetical protein [Ricinus communis]|uniref:Uncharacterized protein n=1 Tax=Ricinus communis TaxID=3988 RepID=B9SPC4_RICCO|nr:conserved hypothetical protein [Ricinus communis]
MHVNRGLIREGEMRGGKVGKRENAEAEKGEVEGDKEEADCDSEVAISSIFFNAFKPCVPNVSSSRDGK